MDIIKERGLIMKGILKRSAAVLLSAVSLFSFTGVAGATTVPVYGKGHYTETYSQATTGPWSSQHVVEVTYPDQTLVTFRGAWAATYYKSSADRHGLTLKHFYAQWR